MDQEAIEELYARWQQNPDSTDTTTELCEALRRAGRPDLVEIVGSHASKQPDLGALLAVARMYADSGRLDDAQGVLLSAGRIDPRAGEVYRWLGDVLLRRGDAERAEKVLEKAIQFGAADGTAALLEQARGLRGTQRTSGPSAVADVVARSSNRLLASEPKPALPAPSSRRNVERLDRNDPPEDDAETKVRGQDPMKAILDAAFGTAPPPSVAPPPLQAPPPSVKPPPLRAPPIEDLIFTRPTRGLDFQPSPPQRDDGYPTGNVVPDAPPAPAAAATASFDRPSERRHDLPPPSGPMMPPSGPMMPGPTSSARFRADGERRDDGARRGPGEPPMSQRLLDLIAKPGPKLGGAPIPEPRDVLEALQIAGVYEPDGAVAPQVFTWTAPERTRRWMSAATLIALAVGLVTGGVGTFKYVRSSREKAHVQAEQILATTDHHLAGSDARNLEPAEKTIARAFELESRSAHAALTWLHERGLVGLLKGGADLAFEDAIQRAKAVGVEDKRIAFAHVASFLYQGDTAGSAATVAKWDSVAQDDAWFQLLAGATFERAGDPRALERYAAAVRLDPELVIAQILLTRSTAIEGDLRHATELAKEFRSKNPERIEGVALIALTWTRDPLRGEPPPEIKEAIERVDALPPALRAVPHAARAILALHRGAVDEAKPSLQKGLDVADSPGIATWLGGISLATGDDGLARKAALTALSFSAVYQPARVLAARVALLAARLDEALKATEDLPATWADVAVVTAAASYEKLDGERIARAFEAVPEDARRQLFVVPLLRGQGLLAGNLGTMNGQQAFDMADDEAPWADLVAMDWALDAGDLDLAKKIAERWKGETRALRALRLARLSRYDGKLEEADKHSRAALESGTVTIRALTERVFTLLALKKDAEALALFKTYPNVGGPLAKWLKAYATAAHGKIDEAKAMVSQEDPPPALAPMPARMIAASAYGMMKDIRHGNEYTRPIIQAGFVNPDIVAAAEKLNLGKPGRRGR